jgi:hypothetical protein
MPLPSTSASEFQMKNIVHRRLEGIEVLTIARPPANALDIETTEELADAFEALYPMIWRMMLRPRKS